MFSNDVHFDILWNINYARVDMKLDPFKAAKLEIPHDKLLTC